MTGVATFLICQISDIHAVPRGELAYGAVDTRAALEAAVKAIRRLERAPDIVVVSGDLVDKPNADVYDDVAKMLARLPMPVFIVPGNHDATPLLLQSFPVTPTIAAGRFVGYAIEDYPVRLIGLDTTKPGTHLPEFCATRLDWLDGILMAQPRRPTLLVMHHPPFATGVEAMDFIGIKWADGLAELVRRHPQIMRVACGHHHRILTAGWAGTIVTVAPSIAHQFPSRFSPDALPALTLEAPGMLLHWWTGSDLVTHAAPVDAMPTREFFAGQPHLWHQARDAILQGCDVPQVQTESS